jgi:hypothetical protein
LLRSVLLPPPVDPLQTDSHDAPGDDLPGDAVRVASDAMDLLGGDGMQELETNEVQAGLCLDDPATVKRILDAQHREVDPGESGVETRAP